MYLTGIADEASANIEGQISATKELGWTAIESRFIDGKNIHDLEEDHFEQVCEVLEGSGVYVNAFGSAIGNWAKDVRDDFSITEAEILRAIPRMKRLGTKFVRIMSYKVLDQKDQLVAERIRRLRLIVEAFSAEGITCLHENCMNYGGMSWVHTIELLEAVPGMKLVFDTGNPAFNRDRSKEGLPWQDSWEFYQHVKEHVSYIHVKDCLSPDSEGKNKETYVYPGEGQGYVREILQDLKERGFEGGISIEPHMAAVFHQSDSQSVSSEDSRKIYIRYGRRLSEILDSIGFRSCPYFP